MIRGQAGKPYVNDEGTVEDPRRASPLLVHVLQLGERDFRTVLTYLPAQLLPAGREICFSQVANGRSRRAGAAQPIRPDQGDIVARFLAALEKDGQIKRVAP